MCPTQVANQWDKANNTLTSVEEKLRIYEMKQTTRYAFTWLVLIQCHTWHVENSCFAYWSISEISFCNSFDLQYWILRYKKTTILHETLCVIVICYPPHDSTCQVAEAVAYILLLDICSWDKVKKAKISNANFLGRFPMPFGKTGITQFFLLTPSL